MDSFQTTALPAEGPSPRESAKFQAEQPQPANRKAPDNSPLLLTPEMRVDTGSANGPLLLTPEMMVSGPKLSASTQGPTGNLTIFEDPAPEKKEGFTLAEAARSATGAIGRGLAQVFLGDQLAPFRKELNAINSLEEKARALQTPEQFAAKTAEFKQRLEAGESLEKLRPEAYAVAREAARQATGMRAYDCQVLGALAMDDSHIAEMRTGEGKTLTAVLPLYLNALAGKGAHLVTVNEPLAKRDSEWMGPIFERLGMTVGCVTEDQQPAEKRANYNCDVTYVSDRALGFDYLRDQQAYRPEDRVQRGHFFALIDEVDEVLIDEARTPMIMSGKAGEASSDYRLFGHIVKKLDDSTDFKINEEKRTTWLTEDGLRFVENEIVFYEAQAKLKAAPPGSEDAAQAAKDINFANTMRAALRKESQARLRVDKMEEVKPNLLARAVGRNGEYDSESANKAEAELAKATEAREKLAQEGPVYNLYELENDHRLPYLMASLKAMTLFERGKDYTVEDGEVKIVDTNKGRVSDGKRFSQGLHQALEVKEGLAPRSETRTVSKITMPELVGLYERKAGMTGTAKTSEGEFIETYGLDVVQIPTNKPVIRKDHTDVVFATKEAKFQKVVEEAMKSANGGRPVLIGTISVNSNRDVAARLLNAGWPHDKIQILNAETVKGGEDSHDQNAGRSGSITLTTGDRAKLVNYDKVNYKKLAFTAIDTVSQQRKPMLVEVGSAHDAEHVQAWLGAGEVQAPITDKPGSHLDAPIQIRVKKPGQSGPPEGFLHLSTEQFKVDKPLLFKVGEENEDEVVAKALQAMQEGDPVILESATTKQLGSTAEKLLDHGLGLEALPMVCEGKEKENVMIEMAGRAGMITVATNMAGRGANIKPDLINTDAMSELAYEKASGGEAVVLSLDKKSQADKVARFLKDIVPVSLTDQPDAKPEAGKVLVRYGKELPAVAEGTHIDGNDYRTGGLLVIGTERATSRRIDDQLIGRSGRQGAEGDSVFFLSLEDEIPRIYGGEKLEPLLDMFGNAQEGVKSGVVNNVLDSAQQSIENMHIEQRNNASKYRDTHKQQRETWYAMRDSVLTGENNIVEYSSETAALGLGSILNNRLEQKKSYTPQELEAAVASLAEELATQSASRVPEEQRETALVQYREALQKNLQLPESVKAKQKIAAEDVAAAFYPSIEKMLSAKRIVPDTLRANVLRQMDLAWVDHLEMMDELQDGIHLVGYAQEKPELVFPRRAMETFKASLTNYQANVAAQILPAAALINA